MKLEKQVTSLELSKKLKELGVKQDGWFIWMEYPKGTWYVYERTRLQIEPVEIEKYSAFTVAELGEMLPDYASSIRHSDKKYHAFHSWGLKDKTPGKFGGKYLSEKHGEVADTEANARAKMLIYLLENELLKVLK